MEKKFQLPEGYTPVEYIEYRPKQERLFAYGRFEKYKDALAFANHINAISPNAVSNITACQLPDDVVFSIIIPEHVFDIVGELRKEESAVFEPPVNVTYNCPILYRFIEEQYVDMFFKTGKLKLTTFENCKKLEDANRKDENEGRCDLYGYDGQYTIKMDYGVGSDAIMLCTSLCSDYTDDKGIAYKKYIEIFDVQGLLIAIAEQLKGIGCRVKNIMFGPCFYTKKELHGEVHSEAFREKLDKEKKFDWDEMTKLANTIGGNNMFFQKPIEKRSENEFRLLWIVDDIKKDQDIFVTVPNPERYCKIIDSNN